MEWLKTELCVKEPGGWRLDVEDLKYYLKNLGYWKQFEQMKYFEVSWYFYACKFLS